jgi:hypothetical protein
VEEEEEEEIRVKKIHVFEKTFFLYLNVFG